MIAGSLEVEMFANIARLTNDMNQAKGIVGNSMNSVEKSVESAKKVLATLGLGLSVGVLANKFQQVAIETDKLRGNLVTVTGSTEAAGLAFENLTQFAAKTPFTLDQSVNAFIKLKALGLDPSERALNAYGNTAAAMGKDMSQMIEAVADASTNEFERLKEFGIKAKQQGDNVTFTFQGVSTTVAKESEAIQEYLLGIGETTFGDAMANQMERLPGKLSNLEDNVDSLFRTIADQGGTNAFADGIGLASDAVVGITGFVEDFTNGWPLASKQVYVAISQMQINLDALGGTFSSFLNTGEQSLESWRFAFFDTFDAAGEKNIGTVQGMIRVWSIGMTNITAGVQTMGVKVGSTMDKVSLFFGMGSKSALEFAQEVEKIRLAQEGAARQIQSSANQAFEELDRLRDEMLSSSSAANDLSGATQALSTTLTTLVNPAFADLNVKAEQSEFRMLGVTGAVGGISGAAPVAGKAVGELSKEVEYQKNMLENVQREWGNLIYQLIDSESDFGDFFDSIAKGFARMVSDMAAADLASAIFGGKGLGAFTSGELSKLFSGGDVSPSSLISGAGSIGELGGLLGIGGGAASTLPAAGAGAEAWAGFYGAAPSSGGLMSSIGGFMTSPVGIAAGVAIAAKLIHDKTSDPDGYTRSSAGFLSAPTAGAAGNTFSVNAFASGFNPVGFADKTSKQDALAAIDIFRGLDQSLVAAIQAAGGFVNLSRATLSGFNGDGQAGTSGTFFGLGGKTTDLDVAAMATSYAKQLVKHIEGLSPEIMAQLAGARDSTEIASILEGLAKANDGLNDSTDSNTRAIQELTIAYANAKNATEAEKIEEARLKANLQSFYDRQEVSQAHRDLSAMGLSDVALGSSTGLTPEVVATLKGIYDSGDIAAADSFALANPDIAEAVGYSPRSANASTESQSGSMNSEAIRVDIAIMNNEISELTRAFKDIQVRGILTRTS